MTFNIVYLGVTTFTPTPTGFQAVFNGVLDTSVLNLYDSLGPVTSR